DGFGRSDTRKQLRYFFEVDRNMIAYTAVKALADQGELPIKHVIDAMKKYGIDAKKPDPVTL
ncbi:MAG: pyruvate dehydrogenase, partial [Gammaproteobacteria bacterium]